MNDIAAAIAMGSVGTGAALTGLANEAKINRDRLRARLEAAFNYPFRTADEIAEAERARLIVGIASGVAIVSIIHTWATTVL